MKNKMLYGILIFCVSVLMLMPNALASTFPILWINQAILSTPDPFASQDPENSGFGTTQVTVWEEWNGGDWDIYMIYSLGDGAPGTWVFPVIPVAINPFVDEINPAVSVTRNHMVFTQEIHVVYQSWNPGGFWEIMHIYTPIPAIAWVGPVPISTPLVSATNPAIVYTEDQGPIPIPGLVPFAVQAVWEEALVAGGTEIRYRAYFYDFTLVPVRGYLPGILALPFLIRTPPFPGGTCELPEIASTDERLNLAVYDFNFNIVWQEFDPIVGNWNVWYVAGTTRTSPPPPPAAIRLFAGSLGRLNAFAPGVDHTDPDIAASQDYFALGPGQSYYFHVDYVMQNPGPPITFNIDQCYCFGITPTPTFAVFLFLAGPVVTSVIPPPPIPFDNPTIATKLTSPAGLPPATFETWFAWEDNTVPPATDIWFSMGTYNAALPPFGYTVAAVRVNYLPNPDISTEQNPEFWNREDVFRPNPPLTHLVFDKNPNPIGVEIEYIDP